MQNQKKDQCIGKGQQVKWVIKLQIGYYKYAELRKRKYEDRWKMEDIKKNKIKFSEKNI